MNPKSKEVLSALLERAYDFKSEGKTIASTDVLCHAVISFANLHQFALIDDLITLMDITRLPRGALSGFATFAFHHHESIPSYVSYIDAVKRQHPTLRKRMDQLDPRLKENTPAKEAWQTLMNLPNVRTEQ